MSLEYFMGVSNIDCEIRKQSVSRLPSIFVSHLTPPKERGVLNNENVA